MSPIVPAEVSRSSVLIDRLREIATGRGGTSGGAGVHIENLNINLQGPQDAQSIASELKKALQTELSSFEFGNRVEAFVHRANRAYIA